MAGNQNLHWVPRKRAHQAHHQPHAMKPEVIFEEYLDIHGNYLDMVRPTPIYRPASVIRSAPLYLDSYDILRPQREAVFADQRGTSRGHPVIATWHLYADDSMRVPERSRIPIQQMMSPRTSPTRPQRQDCPQQQENPQQQARPQQHQQRESKQNFRRGEDYREDRSFLCNRCNEMNKKLITICFKCRTPRRSMPPSRCNIHRNSYHTKIECNIVCGFCDLRGSHPSNECARKEYIKQNFIENKIRKHGVTAENLALSLVTNNGINKISDEEFERRLRGQPIPPYNRTFEDYQRRSRRPE